MSKKTGNGQTKQAGFGELLRAARTKAGMSVRDLAAATKENPGPDVSITLISLLEQNKRIPTYETAAVLAEIHYLDIDTALEATHASRIQHCIDREEEAYDRAKAKYENKTI